MPASHWWIKIQHDTLQQCFANIAVLPAPIVLMAFNAQPNMTTIEWSGLSIWLISWCLESAADSQKQIFISECKSKTAVLGHPPWDGRKFCLWTLSRHPNYFFEWICWCGFVLASVPSLLILRAQDQMMDSALQIGFVFLCLGLIRFFFDCLMYWTGAEPAEYFSVLKRPAFREYQSNVRVFFPFEVPFMEHYRVAGWPGTTPE